MKMSEGPKQGAASAARPLENVEWRTAVREGIAEADRGELVDDDEVRIWLEQQERRYL
jgi:predicted transcriptional regulator